MTNEAKLKFEESNKTIADLNSLINYKKRIIEESQEEVDFLKEEIEALIQKRYQLVFNFENDLTQKVIIESGFNHPWIQAISKKIGRDIVSGCEIGTIKKQMWFDSEGHYYSDSSDDEPKAEGIIHLPFMLVWVKFPDNEEHTVQVILDNTSDQSLSHGE